MSVNPKRVHQLNSMTYEKGPWIYWMSRDQRVNDNWALLYAIEQAQRQQQPLAVVFCLTSQFLAANHRSYQFMLSGLMEVATNLRAKHIPFYILDGAPPETLPQFIIQWQVGAVVTDFSPLTINRAWKEKLCQSLAVPIFEVDAHNLVPVWEASNKQEFSARTLKHKLLAQLPTYLEDFPAVPTWQLHGAWPAPKLHNHLLDHVTASLSGPEINEFVPGEKAGHKVMTGFLQAKLPLYAEQRNNPLADTQSNLSPYLHFGQLSAQRVILELQKVTGHAQAKEVFSEELLIRRELADNFCFHQLKYDSVEGFADWAQKTLADHETDQRPYLYSLEELELAHTHDPLWNASQLEMVKRGKMHGYLRMYWAKKILEWTPNAQTALKYAIYLNDTYELDGRDPNGYTGMAWSIGGVHDRPWFNRPVFGLIRYMSYSGMQKKFDVNAYCSYVSRL